MENTHVEFDKDHLKRLDSLCLLDENTLLDIICLNINDINFISSFTTRNEKSEISQDCLIVPVAVRSAVKATFDKIFLNNHVNIQSEPSKKSLTMDIFDKIAPVMKAIDRFLFCSASFLLKKIFFINITNKRFTNILVCHYFYISYQNIMSQRKGNYSDNTKV